jgi:phage terminase large subunit GpA-like protein
MNAAARIFDVVSRSVEPRKPMTVSQWSDRNRILSSKESPRPGQWRTSTNPPLREPMDAMSKGSKVREEVVILPIQFGKTNLELNKIGYTIDHDPAPTGVFLPDDLTREAWTLQKFNPLIDETPAIQRAMTTMATRNTANQRSFKDFAGGQIYIEHGKTATRLSLKSLKYLLVDELDKFAAALQGGEDPLELIRGRVSAFQTNSFIAYVGTPGLKGLSRLEPLYEASDQRLYHIPCPHCGHEQPLEWRGLQWSPDRRSCWYVCRESGCVIEESDKTEMIARGRWVPMKPGAKIRGYRLNCLYYPLGLGPRWLDLVGMWLDAQGDPAKLQVFVQERLAEAWEDPKMRIVRNSVIRERAENYRLREAPMPVCEITAGVDTQDNRLEVQIVGWGENRRSWTLDYAVLPGDPENDDVWTLLTDLINRPIQHACGKMLRVKATAIDMGGHRTEAVKNYVRKNLIFRPMAIFGATSNNAPALGRFKLEDVTFGGRTDKQSVRIFPVGTIAIKDLLYGRLGSDAEPKRVGDAIVPKEHEDRLMHFSEDLEPTYFTGLVSETFDPSKNRYVKRGSVRNEPLDTWVYAFAATQHPELRLHRRSKAEWAAAILALTGQSSAPAPAPTPATQKNPQVQNVPRGAAAKTPPPRGGFGSDDWGGRW